MGHGRGERVMCKGGERKGRTQIYTHGHFIAYRNSSSLILISQPPGSLSAHLGRLEVILDSSFPLCLSCFSNTISYFLSTQIPQKDLLFGPSLQSTAKLIVKALMVTTAHSGNKNSLLIGVCLLIRPIFYIARNSFCLFAHLFFSSEQEAHVEIRT